MLKRFALCRPAAYALGGIFVFASISSCGHADSLPSTVSSISPAAGLGGASSIARATLGTTAAPVPCFVTGIATPAPAISYQQLVLGDTPIAYYQLADAGTTLTDSGPNHLSGTYGASVVRGSAAITSGATAAASFPGGPVYNAAGFAQVPKIASLALSCPTVEAWFTLNASNTTNHDLPIVAYGDVGRGARYGLFIHGMGGGQQTLQIQLRAAGQKPLMILSRARLSLNTPYHVVVSYDGVNLVMYINGAVDGVYSYLGNIDYSSYFANGLQIGGANQAASWGSASFPGTIAQVAVYALPLRAVQVENHYLSGRIASMQTERPAAADTFVDSFGLNTHFESPHGIYGTQYPQVKALLTSLGVRHIRAGMTSTDPAFPAKMKEIAAAGVRASYVTQLNMTQSFIQSFPATVGDSFEQYEPPNEADDVGNPNWLPTCISFQKNLWTWVKTDPQIARYPVIGPSIVGMNDAVKVGDLSAYMDNGNLHDYFSIYNPGTYGWGNIHPPFGIYGSIMFNTNIARVVSGKKPIQATETGYGTIVGNTLTLSYRAHLRYMTRLFFEQFNGGIVRTYSYELMDEGGTGIFQNFGLVTTGLQPKPAYNGIASLISRLKDVGPAFSTTPLSYELTGFTDPIHHTLLQKRNGHYFLAIWLELPNWVTPNNAGGDIINPPQTVTLHTLKAFSSATIATMDENGNMTSSSLPWNGTSAALSVADKVSLIELTP